MHLLPLRYFFVFYSMKSTILYALYSLLLRYGSERKDQSNQSFSCPTVQYLHLTIEICVMLDCSPHKKLIYTKEELEKVEVNVIDTKPPNESLFIM